ncbi:hypothetical protein GUJ93_ZPchr0016g2502 [Zizania palustris]|uniref:Uncharacterized protein n=1 Tax=Zizania palustris TaxID=103762 RepID=A0A8J5SYZ6_ZIZPA|nr:hypothetical protein GUJ93_ZPchr0016g2502 [Zizania palustris]
MQVDFSSTKVCSRNLFDVGRSSRVSRVSTGLGAIAAATAAAAWRCRNQGLTAEGSPLSANISGGESEGLLLGEIIPMVPGEHERTRSRVQRRGSARRRPAESLALERFCTEAEANRTPLRREPSVRYEAEEKVRPGSGPGARRYSAEGPNPGSLRA